MKQEKYVAYVGTYTYEHSIGIHIYDLDVEQGKMNLYSMFLKCDSSHTS